MDSITREIWGWTMFIECTKKLSDAMKMKVQSSDVVAGDEFYQWHADLFIYNRRKGVLLMNNKTRYAIVLYGLRMEHFKKFDVIFKESVRETFIAEGFGEEKVDKYLGNCGEAVYTKTHNRSIVGQIIDFKYFVSDVIEEHLPSEKLYLVELNQWLGDTPCVSINTFPINLLRKEME